METGEQDKYLQNHIAVWTERAEIARKQGQNDVVAAAMRIASAYEKFAESAVEFDEPKFLAEANILRKRIESSEQHRTMCVEHGLSNAAIDATYEIQQMERDLVALMSNE